MAVTLLIHPACTPALYGALAASVAQAQNAVLMHLPVAFTAEDGADAVQMVAAAGALVPSGLLWYERLTGREILPVSTLEDIIAAARHGEVVVPLGTTPQCETLRGQLLEKAADARVPVTQLKASAQAGVWRATHLNGQATEYGAWIRDSFGRWVAQASIAPLDNARHRISIALLGAESDQLNVYPATLAALGDAADAVGVDVDVRFISPPQLDCSLLDSVAGILLPGGSDMINVPGQIEAAHHGVASHIPTLGLCLGMQSMTTAVAQRLPGLEHANMAEAAPEAEIKTFVPMSGIPGLPGYRVGTQALQVTDAALKQVLGDRPAIRCNHRYMLNPQIIAALKGAGLVITANDLDGQITDAIDWPQHPFYKGMQGHPEISSSATRPHPLIQAFVQAALAFDRRGNPAQATG
jgi:CTP synthase